MEVNRAHIEPLDARLGRFIHSSPTEVIETLLNSIDNYFNNEIALTTQDNHYQTTLLFLGIHAVALTIAEVFYGRGGIEGYKLFLENYVDGDTPDTKFSQIYESIHKWRNIVAHQWLGLHGYNIDYDYTQTEGWKNKDGVFVINPKIYSECYLSAFNGGGKIWKYGEQFSNKDLETIKVRIIKKFIDN